MKRRIPWPVLRNECHRCGGLHAPWWNTTPAPSCGEPVSSGHIKRVRRAMTGMPW